MKAAPRFVCRLCGESRPENQRAAHLSSHNLSEKLISNENVIDALYTEVKA